MLGLILKASSTQLGIEIETNDVDSFKNLFYRTTRKYNLRFSLKTAPTPNHLWIVPHAEDSNRQSNPEPDQRNQGNT